MRQQITEQLYDISDAIEIAEQATKYLSADPFTPNRKRETVYARRMVMAYLREKGFVFTNIGRIFDVDHSTVIHNIKEHESIMSLSHFKSYRAYCSEYYRMWNALEFRDLNEPTWSKERITNTAWML